MITMAILPEFRFDIFKIVLKEDNAIFKSYVWTNFECKTFPIIDFNEEIDFKVKK